MDLTVASSLGGIGWRDRITGHDEEVAAGRVWARCGGRSEASELRAVMLAEPPESLRCLDPRAALMRSPVDLDRLRDQYEMLTGTLRRMDVTVWTAETGAHAPPNVIFMRDLFFMTPRGAVVGRMASAQRAGEERYAARALAVAGIPIVATITGHATFEGADALWLDEGTVVVGFGRRTNRAGVGALRRVLAQDGVRVIEVPLGPMVQHLLGTLMILDEKLAAVRSSAAGAELRAVLRGYGYQLIELPDDDDMLDRRGMNLLTLGPRRVLIPAGASGIRRRLEAAGVTAEEVEVREYLNADGALGCLTGIVHRN
ncbi:dimethylarginine dimethylaminohydrolase family protein [Streptomyces tendae]|uniref:dimethylarginine dimethylaminohydrolase family protein n=1 Tax=Streptomyces tendae TaxID=1932 RepID=UPI003696B377